MVSVIIVDDDPGVLALVEASITRNGFEAWPFAVSNEALEAIRRRPFDVAIVDYEMPVPNGLEVLRQIREYQPRCVRILMSGRLDLPILLDAVNRGEIHRVLEKPAQPDAILGAIRTALQTQHEVEDLLLVANAAGLEQQRVHLNECFDRDLLQLALQPIFTAKDRSLFAYEALLRSKHPEMNTPDAVLAAAERHGRIDDLADVVWARAHDWLRMLRGQHPLFINIHPDEMNDPQRFYERIRRVAGDTQRLVLEITERSSVLSLDSWQDSYQCATEAGLKIAVDDLGSGYNSLTVLAELQPTFIKVDISIVRSIDQDQRKRRLVDLLCRFSDATQAQLIAEGVESEGEADTLTEIGVHYLQGFLLGRPAFHQIEA